MVRKYYQSDLVVSEYFDAHYGPDKFGVENFSAALIKHCLNHDNSASRFSALDIGCAVGRSSFELAAHFDEVVGIDCSTRFIDIARRIQERGVVAIVYSKKESCYPTIRLLFLPWASINLPTGSLLKKVMPTS